MAKEDVSLLLLGPFGTFQGRAVKLPEGILLLRPKSKHFLLVRKDGMKESILSDCEYLIIREGSDKGYEVFDRSLLFVLLCRSQVIHKHHQHEKHHSNTNILATSTHISKLVCCQM